jgi:hypothetical protein
VAGGGGQSEGQRLEEQFVHRGVGISSSHWGQFSATSRLSSLFVGFF